MLFSPSTIVANDLPPPEVATPTPEAPKPTDTSSTVKPEGTPALDTKALLEAINADREAREKNAREAQERDSYKKRAEDAEARLEGLEKAKKNRLLDPVGYLKRHGYTDKDLALTAEGIMFTLMPDKAPAGWVQRMVQAQREQDQLDAEEREKTKAVEAEKKASEAKSAEEKEIESRYRLSLEREVASLKPGTFKASQAWFADDHKGYAAELFATATQLAETAMKEGRLIDNVSLAAAQELEKKYEERAKRLASVYTQAPAPQKPTTQPSHSLNSTVNTSQQEEKVLQSPPSQGKLSDKEIIERATKAAFGRF